MKVEQVVAKNLKREYNVIVAAKEIDGKIASRLNELSKKIKMPGFRPGKVPLSLVKKNYGQSIMGEVLELVVEESSRDALSKEGLKPALQPKIEIITFEEGKDLQYKMEFEILPEVPEVDLSKIKIEKPTANVDEKEVDEAISRIASQHKHYNPLKEERAAKKGDAVEIDFKGFVDGEAFEGGEAKNFRLELGSNSFINGFEAQLEGTNAGDKIEVNVTFPESYHAERLAGKPAKFEVTIHKILEVETHKELDDEFSQHMGFETMDKLKEAVSQQIEKEIGEATRSFSKKNLFDAFDKECAFSIPEQMLEMEFEAIWKQVEEARKSYPESEEFKKSDSELEKEYREMADRRVRLAIFLADVGKKHNITVSNEELNRAVLDEARKYPGQEKAVFEFYQKNPQQMMALRGPVLEEKVVDFILGKVKTEDKVMSLEELRSYGQEKTTGADKKKPASSKKSSGGKAAPKKKK